MSDSRYSQLPPEKVESKISNDQLEEAIAGIAEQMPQAWSVEPGPIWNMVHAPHSTMPAQGWKIHISSVTENYPTVLNLAIPILIKHGCSFKYTSSLTSTRAMNNKLWPREGASKLVTVYPDNTTIFLLIGAELTRTLEIIKGPYILSDKRWPKSKCVHFRYGGFISRTKLRYDGVKKQVIEDHEGKLVHDARTPYWSLPSWVTSPIEEQKANPEHSNVGNLAKYEVKSSLNFSSRGGVYKAIEKQTNHPVVLKEARYGIEIGKHSIDAHSVLKKEFEILSQLSRDCDYFVEPLEFFDSWEHCFLVEEFVDGVRLGTHVVLNNPLYLGDYSREALSNYLNQMREIWLQIAKAIDFCHQEGIVIGDLSFTNILICDNQHVKIIDMEAAIREEIDPLVGLYTLGISGHRAIDLGVNDRTNDFNCLGSLMLGSIAIVNTSIGYHPQLKSKILQSFQQDLSISMELASLIDELMTEEHISPVFTNQLIDRLGKVDMLSSEVGVLSNFENKIQSQTADDLIEFERQLELGIKYLDLDAQFERNDFLFSSDINLFQTNPVSVAHGASGVLYAKKYITGETDHKVVDWILKRDLSTENCPPGLYCGLSGVAWSLLSAGHTQEAIDIHNRVEDNPLLLDCPDMLFGIAGHGMTCLKFWLEGCGQRHLDSAVRAGDHLVKTSRINERGRYWTNPNGDIDIGYSRGSSGISLFLLYLAIATENENFLAIGQDALSHDLSWGGYVGDRFAGFPSRVTSSDNVLSCYWQIGTAGIMTSLVRYFSHSKQGNSKNISSDSLLASIELLSEDLHYRYTAFPNLFMGIAGIGNCQLDLYQFLDDRKYLVRARQCVRSVLLTSIETEQGVCFTDESGRGVSCDFATGSAGIMCLISRLLNDRGNFNFTLDELLDKDQVCEK